MTIGILSTIAYTARMSDAFNRGLSDATAQAGIKQQVDQGFKSANLHTAIKALLNGGATLIATFGGVAACKAAINYQTTQPFPFISLVGTSDHLSPGGNFKGCVNLTKLMGM